MLLSDRFLGFFMVPGQVSWNYNFMGELIPFPFPISQGIMGKEFGRNIAPVLFFIVII